MYKQAFSLMYNRCSEKPSNILLAVLQDQETRRMRHTYAKHDCVRMQRLAVEKMTRTPLETVHKLTQLFQLVWIASGFGLYKF